MAVTPEETLLLWRHKELGSTCQHGTNGSQQRHLLLALPSIAQDPICNSVALRSAPVHMLLHEWSILGDDEMMPCLYGLVVERLIEIKKLE